MREQVVGTEVLAYVSRVREVEAGGVDHDSMTLAQIESNPVRCPDQASADLMYNGEAVSRSCAHPPRSARSPSARLTAPSTRSDRCRSTLASHNSRHALALCAAIDQVRTRGESCGGEVTCVVRGCPKGLGNPVFDKLEAELAKAIMSLPATKVRMSHLCETRLRTGCARAPRPGRGSADRRRMQVQGFEIGSGFSGSRMLGSEHNDSYYMTDKGEIRTRSNRWAHATPPSADGLCR